MAATVIAGNDFGLLDSSLAILKRGDQTSQSKVGGGQNLYINASNGNLVVQQQDIYLPSLGDDFQLVRTYNSQAKLHGESNWSLSTGINLKFVGPLIVVEKADGSEFDYKFDKDSGIWISTDGATAYEKIEKVHNKYWPFKPDPELDPSIADDHWGYVLTRADQSKMYFDKWGTLQASVDPNGVRMDYEYHKGRLSKIYDDKGHEINFCYDRWGRLTSIHDEQENDLVKYEYTFGHDRLTAVTDRNGHVTRYSYDNHGLLTSIELPNQQLVDGKWESYDSRKLEFTYSFESIPSTHKGWGPTLSSVTDAEGGITTFEYFDDSFCWYLDNGGSTRVVDALGNARAYSNAAEHVQWRQDNGFYAYYNKRDHYTSYQSGLIREQHAVTYTYSENGYLLEARDQQGYRTQYNYNERGDLISASDNNAWALTHSNSDYYRNMRKALGVVDLSGQGKLVSQLNDADKALLVEAHTSHYEYDDQGNLIRFEDNNGTETVFVYDEFNNLLSSTSAEAARLINDQSEEAQAKRETLGFSADATLLTDEDKAAITELFTTRFEYDENHNLTQRTDNGGDITRFEYDVYGNLTKQIVHLDNQDLVDVSKQQITQYFYDVYGNNIETVDPEGNHSFAEYDHFGNVTKTIDSNGGITTYLYDKDNRLIAKTDAEGNTTQYSYDAVGNMISTTDANGHTIINIYDKNNRLITVIDPAEDNAAHDRVTHFAYDVVGNQTSVTNAEGFTTTYFYDTRRQLVEVHTPDFVDENGYKNNYATRYTYDGLGNVLTQEDNNGNLTSYVYNQDSLLIHQEQPDGNITQFVYDENNNQVKIIAGVQLPEAKRQILKFVHDEEDQIIEQTDAMGFVTRYAIDAVGNQTELTDANGNRTSYKYDANNRLIKVILPEVTDAKTGQPVQYTQELSYDGNGNVVSSTNENGETTHFYFDKNNRQILVEDANGVFTRYGYDAKGQRTSIEIGVDMARNAEGELLVAENIATGQSEYEASSTQNAQINTYVYDEFGQVVSETDGLGNALAGSDVDLYKQLRVELGFSAQIENLSEADKTALEKLHTSNYEYDRVGNLTAQTDNQGNVTQFKYDALNRAIKSINALGGELQFEYDGNGNQTKAIDELGRVTTFKYDAYDRLVETTQALGTQEEVTTKSTYDIWGNLLEQTEAAGSLVQRSTRFEYDLNNRQTLAMNAEGHFMTYEYDALGNRLAITDAKGLTTRYVYDALNRNVQVIDPMSFETRYEYDGVGNRVAITDKNGNQVKYEYDPENQLIKTIQKMENGQDRITEFAYDARGNQIQMKTAAGTENEEVTLFTYDAENNLRAVEDAEGGVTTQGYDRVYNQTSTTDANGHISTMAYDALNRLVVVTDALGNETRMSYDATGNQLTLTDGNNHTTAYEYDALNRRVVERDAFGVETHFAFDKVNNQTAITYAAGTDEQTQDTFEYYADGQLKARIDASGARTEYVYDKNNNTVQTTDAEGFVTRYTLDDNNRVTSIIDPEGGVLSYLYDSNGNRTQIINAEGHKTSFYYNAANEVVLKIDAEGFATSYVYDANGNQISSTLHMTPVAVPSAEELSTQPVLVNAANDQTTLYSYDKLNRLVEKTDAEGYVTQYGYDAVGNRTLVRQQVTQEGLFAETHYFYDAVNRVASTVSAEGLLTQFEYDGVGNRTALHVFETAIVLSQGSRPAAVEGDRVRTTRYSYDQANRLQEEISAEGYKTQYRYSKRGNRTQTIEAVGLPEQRITENTYDSVNRLVQTVQALGSAEAITTTFEYYADGELKTRTDASGSVYQVVSSFVYDRNNRLIEQSKPNGDGGSQVERFTYDATGNRTQWISAFGTDDQRTYSYEYDKVNQMVREELPFNVGKTVVNEYTFDGAGNRIHAQLSVGTPESRTQSWAYDLDNRLVSAFDSLGVETAFVYDGSGNQIEIRENANKTNGEAIRVTTQTFDLDNRMIQSVSPQGNVTQYQYDALGNETRVSKLVDADNGIFAHTNIYYDNMGRQTHVLSAEGSLSEFSYDAHGNMIEEKHYVNAVSDVPAGEVPVGTGEVQTRTYAYDQLNQLVSQTNANGRVDTFTYDARGNRTSMTQEGRVTYYQYNDANHMTASIETLESNEKRITNYVVDTFGQVTERTDAAHTDQSKKTYFTYDAQGNLLSEARVVGTDAQGAEQLLLSEFSYNTFGDMLEKIIASGKQDERIFEYEYDDGGRLVLETNAEGHQVHFQYDTLGNQRFVTTGYETEDPRTSEYRYDLDNRLVESISEGGIKTRFEYDGVSNQTAVIEAFGTEDARRTETTYDLDNQVVKVTDAMGYTTEFEYDALGNQTLIRQLVDVATESTPARYAETHQYFDIASRLTHSINPEGYLTSFEYDLYDQMTAKSEFLDPVLITMTPPVVAADAAVRRMQYAYDLSGNLVNETDPLGVQNVSVYDIHNNRTEYHENWNEQAGVGERVSTFTYDKLDRLTSKVDAAGSAAQMVTTYDYNSHGDVVRQIDAAGTAKARQADYRFDDAGRMISESHHFTNAQGEAQELRTEYVYDDLYGDLAIQRTGSWNAQTQTLDVLREQWFSYDANKRLVEESNAENERTVYEYDAVGNQTAVHLAYGTEDQRSNYYSYDLVNQVTVATDGNGTPTHYQYDGLGNKTETIQAKGIVGQERITKYQYDLNGNLTEIIDPEGGRTQYVYDYLGNQIQTIDANGGVQTSAFDLMGRQYITVSAGGVKTIVKYDELGNKISEVMGWDDGSKTDSENVLAYSRVEKTYDYDALGRQTLIVDGEGFSTVMEYDVLGNQTKVTRGIYQGSDATKKAREHISINLFTYDQAGRMLSMRDGEGNITTYTYNAVGDRLTMTEASNGLFNTLPRITTYDYDKAGRETVVRNNGGSHTIKTYNAAGDVKKEQILQSKNSESNVWITTLYDYDGNGNLTNSTDDYGVVTHYKYDPMGNQTDVFMAYGTSDERHTRIEFDLNNRKVADIDGEGHRTEYQYDALGNQTVVTDALGREAFYYYNSNNQLRAIVDAEGVVTQFEYDALGNQTSYTVFANSVDLSVLTPENRLEYAAASALFTPSTKDRVTSHNYDRNGNKISTQESDNAIHNYVYDAVGNMVTQTLYANVEGGQRTTTYEYDLNNRLVNFEDVDGTVTTFEYDAASNKVAETVISSTDTNASRRTEYVFNLNNQQTKQISDAGGLNITQETEYDIVGNMIAFIDANGNRTTYTYDKNNRQITERDPEGNLRRNVYDKVGNRTAAINGKNLTTNFEYDKNNREVKVILPEALHFNYVDGRWVEEAFRATTTRVYDAFGNEVQTISNGKVDSEGNNNGYKTTRWFDANGRLVAELNADNYYRTYTYNQFGEVEQENLYKERLDKGAHNPDVLPASSSLTQYIYTMKYDLAGRMTEKNYPAINVSRLVGAAAAPQVETVLESPKETFTYDAYGNQTSVTDKNGNLSFMFYDNLDRQVAVIDPAGYLTEWEYDAQGNTLEQFQYSSTVNVSAITIGEIPSSGFRFNSGSVDQYQVSRRYDAANRMISETMPTISTWSRGKGAQSLRPTTVYTYDAAGNKTSSTRAHGTDNAATEYFYYDGNNRQVAFVDRARVLSSYTYDANGNVTQQKRYFNRLSANIDFINATDSYLKSQAGNNSAYDQQVTNTYDNVNRLTSESTALTTDSLTKTYKYDAHGNQTSVKDHERANLESEVGQSLKDYYETRTAYNGLGQIVRTVSPDGTGSVLDFDIYGNEVLSYTGEVDAFPSIANSISVKARDGLQISWSNGDVAYVVYDDQSHPTTSSTNYNTLINQYANKTTTASDSITLNAELGATRYFRVVTIDAAGNKGVSEEYKVTVPSSYESLSIQEEGNNRVAYVTFNGAVSTPAIQLGGNRYNMTQVSGNQYKVVMPEVDNPQQEFTIVWAYNGTEYTSAAVNLSSKEPHHYTSVAMTPSAVVGDTTGFIVDSVLFGNGISDIQKYSAIHIEWISKEENGPRYVGSTAFDGINAPIEIKTGENNPLVAGEYEVIITGVNDSDKEVLQRFDYNLTGAQGSVTQYSSALGDPAYDSAFAVFNGETTRVPAQDGYIFVTLEPGLSGDYSILAGTQVQQAHDLSLTQHEILSQDPEPVVLGYNTNLLVGFAAEEVANMQGDVTLSWRVAGTGTDFSNSTTLPLDADNKLSYTLADLQNAKYDIKLSYTNKDGVEVIVDWLRFNPSQGNISEQQVHSVTILQTEEGGRLAGNSIHTGFHTGDVALDQIALTVAVQKTDTGVGYVKRWGRETGYFVESEYDALGNLIKTNKDTGIWREYAVDAMGNQIQEIAKGTKENTDTLSYRTSYTQYDALNREAQTWSAIDGKTLSKHEKTTKEYDYAGNLIKETNEDGSYVKYEYNAVGLKTKETHFASSHDIERQDTYSYDILGQETRMVDALGYGVEKEYDDYGNLFREYAVGTGNTESTSKTYSYDTFGRRIRADEYMTGNDTSTKTTSYTYDKADRLTKVIEGLNNAAAHTTLFTLDSRGNRIMTTRPHAGGLGEIEIYDEMGRVITRITTHDKDRVTESKQYDIFGNLVRETDQLGRRSTKVYGAFGRLISETDQDYRTTTYEYDAFGNQIRIVKDAKVLLQDGVYSFKESFENKRYVILERIEIEKQYDAQNRLIKVSEYSSKLKESSIDSWQKLRDIYWANNPPMTLGVNTTYTYTSTGNRETEVIKNGSTELRHIHYQYNDVGEMTRWYDEVTKANLNYVFDKSGRLVNVYTDKGYNPDGGLSANDYHTNIKYVYDELGQLEKVQSWDNGAGKYVTTDSYSYYENGLMKTSTKDGIQYTYEYNGRGDVIRSEWTKAGEAHHATWEYDANGNNTRYEITRIDVINHPAQYVRGVKIKDAWTEYKDVQVQLEENTYITGTNLSTISISKGEKDDGVTTTTTTFDKSGRTQKTHIASPGSTVWYDTVHSRGGTRIREVLNGNNTRNARTLTTQTYFEYDGNGKMEEFYKDLGNDDNQKERRTFVYNNDGQILERSVYDKTKDVGSATYDTKFHYANGEAAAETGKNDNGEAKSELGTGSYSPVKHLGEDFPTGSLSSFTATGGETLRQVAGMILGNQNLWFVLAEANGLQANDTLSAGQTITIPNSVETAKFDSETHKVYNESEIIGNTMPNVRQKKKKKKCGSFLAIVITVVIVALAVYFTGGAALAIANSALIAGMGTIAGFAATVALTALAGAAIYAGLNIVQQGLMIAAGLQEGFEWGQVRDQARQGAIAGALAGMGAFAETLDTADKMKTVINVSKTALNVANKAYQQMEANDGKITNWTGLLMAAAPAVGDLGFEEAATAIEAYGDYATPWLGLAEKALAGKDITSEDYLMAVGNTLSTAIDASNSDLLKGELSKIGAKTLVAGAMYLNDEDAAGDYFKNMVGQEVGQYLSGLAGSFLNSQAEKYFPGMNDVQLDGTQSFEHAPIKAALASISAGISSYASTYVTSRMRGESSRDAFSMAYGGLQDSMQNASVSSFASSGRRTAQTADLFGMAANGIQSLYDDFTNTQRYDFGKLDNIEIVDSLKDGDAIAYGAFDSATGKVMVSRELMNQAAVGDEKASAHLLGLIREELAHREANVQEQELGIKDFQFDEGALAARQMLKALGEHDGNTVFSFSIGDEGFDFSTSADAINEVIDENFGWGRILSDRQSGSLEFNSSNFVEKRDFASSDNIDSLLNGVESLADINSLLISNGLIDSEKLGYKDRLAALASDPTLENLSDADRASILAAALAEDGTGDVSYGNHLNLSNLKDAAMAKGASALDKLTYHIELARASAGTEAGDALTTALTENPKLIGTALRGKTRNAQAAFQAGVEANFYNQFTQVGSTEARQATFSNGQRNVTLDWAADASQLARDHAGLTTDQAIRKTSFNTFDTLLRASFAAGDVASVEINGGWRPVKPHKHDASVNHATVPETGSHGSNPNFDALDVRSISFDSGVTSSGTETIRMAVLNSDGSADKTTTDVSGSYDSRVRNFTEKLAENTTGQIISPWAQRKSKNSPLVANNVTSQNSSWQSALKSHRDHLHFSARE